MGAVLRLAFMGSPGFSVPALRALHAAGHHIVAVYCQPPRPAGRGQVTTPCPVHREALALGLPVRTPATLRRDAAEHAAFASLDLDAAVVAAYGLILPGAMLTAPRRGCLNIHASLLPRWRGASPIQAAILAGDACSGITIMRMDEGLDTGPMLATAALALGPRATASWLHDQLAKLGAALVLRVLDDPPPPVPQPPDGATYAAKLSRGDGLLDWTREAAALDRQIRALNPWPGTFTMSGQDTLKILEAEPVNGPPGPSGPPGTVLDDRVLDDRVLDDRVLDDRVLDGTALDGTAGGGALLIACGEGALRATRLQAPGRPAMDAAALLRGRPIPPGTRLGSWLGPTD